MVLSLALTLSSVLLVIYGYNLCSTISTSLVCADKQCILLLSTPTGLPVSHKFSANELLDADMVRVHEGKVVSISGVKRKVASTYGYSVQLKYKVPAEEGSRIKIQQSALLSDTDIGRGPARSRTSKINNYIDGKAEVGWIYIRIFGLTIIILLQTLSVTTGPGWTFIGVSCILLGILSFITSCVFGQFSDPSPRRLRKTK